MPYATIPFLWPAEGIGVAHATRPPRVPLLAAPLAASSAGLHVRPLALAAARSAPSAAARR